MVIQSLAWNVKNRTIWKIHHGTFTLGHIFVSQKLEQLKDSSQNLHIRSHFLMFVGVYICYCMSVLLWVSLSEFTFSNCPSAFLIHCCALVRGSCRFLFWMQNRSELHRRRVRHSAKPQITAVHGRSEITEGGGFKNAMIAISVFRRIDIFRCIVRSSHFRPLVSPAI